MRSTWMLLFVMVAMGSLAPLARGGDFWSRFKTDYHRNNYWPQPFIAADRAAARDPFTIQTTNGWRLQNTVGDCYFEPDTQELSLAGQMKVKWIVTQTPTSRRTVFVLANENQESTLIRVDSVQRAISRYVPRGDLPEVLLTDRDLNGASGEYYETVDRAMKSTVPAPRLPTKTGGSGGAAASGAGGAGASGS